LLETIYVNVQYDLTLYIYIYSKNIFTCIFGFKNQFIESMRT